MTLPAIPWTRIATADGNGAELVLQDADPVGAQTGYFRVVTVP